MSLQTLPCPHLHAHLLAVFLVYQTHLFSYGYGITRVRCRGTPMECKRLFVIRGSGSVGRDEVHIWKRAEPVSTVDRGPEFRTQSIKDSDGWDLQVERSTWVIWRRICRRSVFSKVALLYTPTRARFTEKMGRVSKSIHVTTTRSAPPYRASGVCCVFRTPKHRTRPRHGP